MKKLLFVAIMLLCSCASVTVLKSGYKPQKPDDVMVILDKAGQYDLNCKSYAHIGIISTAWEWNGNIAINAAKKKTAAIGGNVFIGGMELNSFNDAKVSGNAYICEK